MSASSDQSEARNSQIILRWFEEVWNQRNMATVHELLSPSAVIHGLSEKDKIAGPAGFLPFYEEFVRAFPDLRVKVDAVLAKGDEVAARVSLKGTHTGPGFGIAPTGRSVQTTGIVWVRFENGKVAESWNEFDAAGLFAQLTKSPLKSTMRPS